MMAKTTGKPSSDGNQGASFQVPEVAPKLPDAHTEVAASIPLIPSNPAVTAGKVPIPKERPSYPTPAEDFDPEAQQRTRATQSDAIITIWRPAQSRMTALGTDLLGDCATANQLGTRQPQKALISKSEDKKWFFIMPSHHKSDKGVKINYHKGLASINLFGPFDEMGRLVEKGVRESFALAVTEEPVKIHGVTGYALYFNLTQYLTESIKERDGESAESTTGTAKKSSRKKSPAPEAAADSAQTTTESVTTEPSAEDAEETALERIQEEMLAERDERIHELERKLKEYEKKLGKLE